MASTYSTNLAIELIGTGDQAGAWGNTTNTNLGTLIEQAISGYVTQAVATGTDTSITIPNGATGVARNMYIELTGTGGTNTNLIVPANKKLYFIYNNTSSGQVTVKVAGQTGVSVPNGIKMILVCNGTDIVDATSYINGVSANITVLTAGSATITNLRATSAVITSLTLSNPLGVAQGGTGSSTAPSNGQLLVGNGTGFTLNTLNGGPGVGITNAAGSITITATGTGFIGSVSATSPLQSTGTQSITISLASAVPISLGGTGQTSAPANGHLLIGNGTSFVLSNLTAGTGVTITNGAGSITISASGTGDVAGPASSTDNAVVRFDGTTGKIIQNSTGVTITDGGVLTTTVDASINGVSVGKGAGSGVGNTAIGSTAGDSMTTGLENTIVGATAGTSITTGQRNTTLGYGAGDVINTGSYNTFVGRWAGIDISSGNYNTGIGELALGISFVNCTNSTALGAGASVTGSNEVQLGNGSTNTYYYNSIQARSDMRDKAEIQDTDLGLDFIMALRPRKYKWDLRDMYRAPRPAPGASQAEIDAWKQANTLGNIVPDGTKKRNRFHQGLIAQEVKQVMEQMGVDFGGYQDHKVNGGEDVLSLGYDEMIAPLVKAIQELKAEFDEYKRTHP